MKNILCVIALLILSHIGKAEGVLIIGDFLSVDPDSGLGANLYKKLLAQNPQRKIRLEAFASASTHAYVDGGKSLSNRWGMLRADSWNEGSHLRIIPRSLDTTRPVSKLMDFQPDHVVVELGTNMFQGFIQEKNREKGEKTIKDWMEKMISQIRSNSKNKNIRITWVGPAQLTKNSGKMFSDSDLKNLISVMQKTALNNGVEYLDSSRFTSKEDLDKRDGTHFFDKGLKATQKWIDASMDKISAQKISETSADQLSPAKKIKSAQDISFSSHEDSSAREDYSEAYVDSAKSNKSRYKEPSSSSAAE